MAMGMVKAVFRKFRRSDRLEEHVPWLFALNDEHVLTTCGGILRVVKLRLPDFESQSLEALDEHHRRLKMALARMGNGWSVYLDQWRTRAPAYLPESGFGGVTAARVIDDARRRQFTDLRQPVFQNSAFLVLHYQPQRRDAFQAWLMDHPDQGAMRHYEFFREQSDSLLGELAHSLLNVERQRGDELASYLSAAVTYQPGHVALPAGALAPQLATRDWDTRGRVLKVDDRFVVTVEIRGYGKTLSPLTTDGLHALPFECRWCVTIHGLNEDARLKEIKESRKRWRAKQRGAGAIITEVLTKIPGSGRTNPEADQALADLDELERDLPNRPIAIIHGNVHVWAETEELALERASLVSETLRARAVEARTATLNSVGAPLADMPGNLTPETANLRLLRGEISAATRLGPVTGVSTGTREDKRFGGSALLAALTGRGVPFFWPMNAPGSDLAHTGVVGINGSGKSALLSLCAAQFLRYPDSNVVFFDRRSSFLVTCLALGGDWIELGAGRHGVQPLRAVDQPSERAWAMDWLISALRIAGMAEVDSGARAALAEALGHLAERPVEQRTMTKLCALIGGNDEVRRTLGYYLRGGSYGDLFDGVVESYGSSRVVGIETLHVMQLQDVGVLALTACFRAIERDRLMGSDAPKLLIIDELSALLEQDFAARQIERLARETRKLKVAMMLATQSLVEFGEGRGRVIFDQLGNQIFAPHAEALRPQTAELYRRVGLPDEMIVQIARGVPKRDYLLRTEEATRLVSIWLEGDALRLCGSGTPGDHQRARALLEEGVRPGADFTARWLAESTPEWLERTAAVMAMAAE